MKIVNKNSKIKNQINIENHYEDNKENISKTYSEIIHSLKNLEKIIESQNLSHIEKKDTKANISLALDELTKDDPKPNRAFEYLNKTKFMVKDMSDISTSVTNVIEKISELM